MGTTGSRHSHRPIGFAHRGARAERRENTLDAFIRALELGATGLESDAWATSDGVVILDHDGETGARWRRRPISTQIRSALPHHIPALSELYERCGGAFELSLDVKDPGAIDALLAAAESAGGASGRLWLCHHDVHLLARWKDRVGPAHLVDSTRLRRISEGVGARARALAGAGIDALNLHVNDWSPEAVAEVHAAGVKAFGWDAQSTRSLTRAVELGLDGIYSDHVDRLMAAISSGAGAG